MSGLLDWIFPQHVTCFLCGKEARTDARGLCAACAEKLVFADEQPCPAALDGYSAGVLLDAATEDAIHRMKYDDARYLAPFFASLIVVPESWSVEAIVPVPLHRKKLRQRGYNQSTMIAEELSKRLGFPVEEDLLCRVRDTGTQTRLDASGRIKNVTGAFEASPRAKGKNILLVDDVRTTGATVSECALALRKAGARNIYGVTALARELVLQASQKNG